MEGPQSDVDEGSSATPAILDLELRAPRLRELPATVAILWVGLLAFLLVLQVAAETGALRAATLGWSAASVLTVTICLLGLVALRSRRQKPRLQLLGTEILLPRFDGSPKSRRVPLDEVWSIGVASARSRELLFVDTSRGLRLLPLGAFREPGATRSLIDEVRKRVAELPEGGERLGALDHRARVSSVILSRRPWATWGLAAANLVLFGFELASLAVIHVTAMLRLGANVAPLSLGPEPGRLLAANFLHMDAFHLGVNMLLLLIVGPRVERVVGPAVFVAIYLLTGAAGSVASAFFRPETVLLSIGASGSVLGVICAWAVLNLRYAPELPTGIRMPPRWWRLLGLLMLADFVAGSMLNVDLWAHAGGMAVGAFLTFAVLRGGSFASEAPLRGAFPKGNALLSPRRPCLEVLTGTPGAPVAAALLVAVHAGALTGILTGAIVEPAARDAVTLDRLVHAGEEHLSVVNNLAWRVAEEPGATRNQVAMAYDAARTVHEQAPIDPHLTDTIATLAFRLGEVERAVLLESGLPRDTPEADFYLTQLARFLHARPAGSAPLVLPRGLLSPPGVAVEASGHGRDLAMHVSADRAVEEPVRVVLLAIGEGGLAGAVEAVVPRIGESLTASVKGSAPGPWVPRWPRFELALVDLGGGGLAPGKQLLRAVPAHPEAMALPGAFAR